MLQLTHVSKSYAKALALSDFSYEFRAHNAYGILGINGAGKSTLMGCITQNLSHLGDISYAHLPLWQMGYVPQELAIYPELSVRDNLLFFAAVFKVPKKIAQERARQLMNQVGLMEKAQVKAKHLSGGMKRKLNLITGLIHDPKFLICDEVCVGIDPISRKEILSYLKELIGSGLTVLYTSHYLDEIELLCNRILFLHEGKLILEGETKDLARKIGAEEDSNLSDVFMKVMHRGEALSC